jgi:regulator of RNase E activity RraA
MGKISCDFPVYQEGNEVRAKVGAGTHSVNVESTIGSVTITNGR